MKPHLHWGIYTNIIPNNIKIKLNWAKSRVTNVTIVNFVGYLSLQSYEYISYDIHHPLDVITQTRKNEAEHVQ